MLRTGIEQDQPRSSLPGQLLFPGQAASPSIPGGNFEHPGREHPERECPAWNVPSGNAEHPAGAGQPCRPSCIPGIPARQLPAPPAG